jgi:hypothetical protein
VRVFGSSQVSGDPCNKPTAGIQGNAEVARPNMMKNDGMK